MDPVQSRVWLHELALVNDPIVGCGIGVTSDGEGAHRWTLRTRLSIQRTGPLRRVLRHVRGDGEAPEGRHEVPGVVTLVGAQRDPAASGPPRGQQEALVPFGKAGGGGQAAVDGQPFAVVHEDMALDLGPCSCKYA